MAKKIWIANAQPVAQVSRITVANVQIGDTFTLKINEKEASFVATAATAANVYAGLAAAVAASSAGEWQEVDAAVADDNTYLELTSKVAGVPFGPVTGTTTDAGSFSILVETLQEGGGGVNEIKTVQLAGLPTGGTFTLTFGGQTTAAMAFDITDAAMETALEALSSIGAGNVAVTVSGSGIEGDPYIWTLTFQGTLAATNVAGMTGNGSSLTGAGEITHEVIQEGGYQFTNEIQTITQPTTDSGTYRLAQNPGTDVMTGFSSGMSAGAMQAVLDTYYGGGIAVTRATSGGDYVYTLTWAGGYGGTNWDELTTYDSTGTVNNTHATVQDGGNEVSLNEIQHIHVLHGPTGGTWDLTTDDGTAAGLAYNASASDVQTALEAVTTAGDYSVTRSGSGTEADPYVYEVEFTGNLAATDVGLMSSDASGLTGAEVLVATTTQGSAGTNEVQKFTIQGGTPSGGTFDVTQDFGGGDETAANIPYNATSVQFRTALEGMATPVPGDLSVTGSAGGPWTVTYQGAFASTDIAEATGDGANLTGTGNQAIAVEEITAATGPWHWDNVDNWDTGTLPANSDDVYFQGPVVTPCLYGIGGHTAITLASLNVMGSFSAAIGLPRHNGSYFEYRSRRLAIGATLVNIGQGTGGGPTFIGLDTGSVQATGNVVSTSGGSLSSPAVDWIGTHASNAWTVGGTASFGAAIYSGEVATILTLNQSGNSIVMLGVGVTINGGSAVWNKKGGTGEINSAATKIIHDGGELRVYGGSGVTITTLDIRDGRVIHNATGTITTLNVSDGGRFDKSEDPRATTITNTSLNAGAALVAPYSNLTFTNPISLTECGIPDLDEFDLGSNITIQYTVI